MNVKHPIPSLFVDQPPPARLGSFVEIARWQAERIGDQTAYTFLTPGDVEQMRCVPELVFINCCHLGNTGGGRQCLLLGPDGAGLKLQHDGQEITLITPHAPLGRQLLGQGPGDQVQAATQAWEVLRVE